MFSKVFVAVTGATSHNLNGKWSSFSTLKTEVQTFICCYLCLDSIQYEVHVTVIIIISKKKRNKTKKITQNDYMLNFTFKSVEKKKIK